MTFKPGDKVKFLNDIGGGIVTRVVKQIAYVETSDGFEIPTQFQELVKVDSSFIADNGSETLHKQATPYKPKNIEKQTKVEEEPEQTEDTEDYDTEDESGEEDIINSENSTLNIILGILPVKTKGYAEPDFKVYLISDCSYRMMYTLSVVKENFCYGNKSGMIEDDTKLLINTFSVAELRELQSFKINCVFYKKGIYLPHEPLVYEYKIDLFGLMDAQNWINNDYFEEKAIIVNLTEESLIYEIERMVTESEERYTIQKKRKDFKQKQVIRPKNIEIEEIDLHIEQLTDNFAGLSAGEILDMQLARFTIALDGAIRNNVNKIVFIHGVGNGKLKFELRRALDNKYSHLRYQDASFKEYGYGATMVLLKK